MRFIGVSAASLSVLATTMAVQAADFPVKSQRIVSAPDRSGFYASLDGSQQTINLPTYDLGWKLRNLGPEVGLGPSETYNPRVNGYGLSGALGYVVPDGTFSSFWGERVRFEIKTAYTHAEGTAAGRGPNNDGFAAQMLDGNFGETNGFGLASGFHTWSTLATDYSAWNVGLKVAADHRIGALTLTPSLTVFGGQANNDQRFFQEMGTGPGPGSRNYRAASSVQWTDWGAKLGLDGKVQITDLLNVGLSGNIGTAFRDVSMTATDEYNLLGAFAFTAFSAAASDRTTTPLLANLEASATIQALPNVSLKAFGGLNFDSNVPGISAATYTGSANAPTATTAAGIKFSSETSYYAGARLTIGFNQ